MMYWGMAHGAFVQLVEFRGLVIAGERHGGMASETHHLFAAHKRCAADFTDFWIDDTEQSVNQSHLSPSNNPDRGPVP